MLGNESFQWEAVDLHYWQTRDMEWYDPSVPTTRDGYLDITMTEQVRILYLNGAVDQLKVLI